MILPELGGRVQMALDKTNGYHFVYYNRVIKPALVGLAGPWISGGIEFNWPQHHRPSTFDPVDVDLAAGDDGSQTVWCTRSSACSARRACTASRSIPSRLIWRSTCGCTTARRYRRRFSGGPIRPCT